MHKFGRAVVKLRVPILIGAVLLLIPSLFGYLGTRVNYDMLDYLPSDMDTVKGQELLKDDFGRGAFSLIVTEGMDNKAVDQLTEKIKGVDHVVDALSYANLAPSTLPEDMIPSKYLDKLKDKDASMIAVFFDSGTSADETMEAVGEIRGLANDQVFVSGMSAMVTDLKNIAEREEPRYVLLAVACSLALLLLLVDSWLAPILFLLSIGIAIVYNLGSNIIFGQISYITKCLAAILQLAVTVDYSIFLWHGYAAKREEHPDDKLTAMGEAIGDTLTALTSSMLTASAGFLALCFMSYTLGTDLGLVMAKGCFIGFMASITILPSLLLVFDGALQKTRHKNLIPKVDRLAGFITDKYWVFLILFVVLLVPAIYGFLNKPVYYNVSESLVGADSQLPDEDIGFHIADEKVKEHFDVQTTEMVLVRSDLPHAQAKEMLDRIQDVDGVKYALGFDSVRGGAMPQLALLDDASSSLKSGDWQLVVINSAYKVASDEVDAQVDAINDIVKHYDENAMLIGEAPATKDLITTTDTDFQVVDAVAIAAILLILILVFRGAVLPFVLVAVIEFAILVNLGIPFYTGSAMSFIEPICISTIQLGSAVNYAILMTTHYKRARVQMPKKEAITTAISTAFSSVVTSALSFFAATFGVGLYANVGLISSLCTLMARGAICSMLSVIFVLPALFMLLDKVIVKTTVGFKPKKRHMSDADLAIV